MRDVTLRDVARAAGVHYSTASRALNGEQPRRISRETAERIRRVADELGYRPDMVARGLRQGRTNTIGVIVADLGNPFLAPAIRGVENVLEPNGFMTVIAETQDDSKRFQRVLEHLASRQVDGLITTSARLGSAEMLAAFAEREAPVVLAVRGLPGSGIPTVRADDRRGGEIVAGYLVELGHRTVAQLRGPQDMQSFIDRAEGFESALEALGAEMVEVDATAVEPTYEEGQRLMGYLLAGGSTRPSAVFAHNDPMAIGALDVIERSGLRCPEDVSLIGFNDNQYVDHTCPPLTTVRIHSYEIGREAGEMALRVIRNDGERPPDVVIPVQIVPRASTKRRVGG